MLWAARETRFKAAVTNGYAAHSKMVTERQAAQMRLRARSSTRNVVLIEGGKLRYAISGRGSPVVLIHGFGFDHRMWKTVVSELASDHAVLTYDLRGFGKSSLPRGPYSHAKDLAELLDRLGLNAAHLVGFSLGGSVALDFALSNEERVLTLTLANCIPSGFPRRFPPLTTGARLKQTAIRHGTAAARRRLLRSRLFTYAKRTGAIDTLLPMFEDYSGWHWLNEDPAYWLSETSPDALAALKRPTLVIISEGDQPDVRRAGRWLARNIPTARLVLLHDHGHFSPIEAAQEFIPLLRQLITPLLQQVDARPQI